MTLIHQHDYDSGYTPAMPIVEIQVSRKIGEPPQTLTAIVDSGSDGTMVPIQYLQEIGARKVSTKLLRGTAGGKIEVDLYLAAVQIGNHAPMYTEVVGIQQSDEIILGRDVLNQFVIGLNGLAQVVEISSG